MSIGLRIKEIRSKAGLNQTDFATKIGVKQSPLSQMESGRILPSIETLSNIIREFNISYKWLIDGEGKKSNSQQKNDRSNDNKNDNIIDTKPNVQYFELMQSRTIPAQQGLEGGLNADIYKLRTDVLKLHQVIPIFSFEASAGIVSIFSDLNSSDAIDYIDVPRAPKCDGAIFAAGDSMYPLIKSGDILGFKFINPLEDIFFGEMYIIAIQQDTEEEMLTVKFVQRSDKGDDHIKLVSQNSHHQPIDLPLKRITGMALIKLTLRYNSMS